MVKTSHDYSCIYKLNTINIIFQLKKISKYRKHLYLFCKRG